MQQPIEVITGFIEEVIDASSLFLVDCYIKPTNNIKIFIDGDQGVTIDAISKINKAIYIKIEEAGLYPEGDFSLEVSSPGIDEPLKFSRQYPKNIGRTLAVTLNDDTEIEGTLLSADGDVVVIEQKGTKKTPKTQHELSIENIKKAVVQISF